MPKRGDIDSETGKIFWCNRKRTYDTVEEWLSPETFNDRNQKLIDRRKRRYEKRREEYKEKAKRYYEENKENCIKRSCERQSQNPNVKRYKREWIKKRRQSSPTFRLISNYRNLIYLSLTRQSTSKENTSFNLLGMTGEEFMEYLLNHPNCDSKFTKENYGKTWHVDHIKPLAAFDLSQEDQQKEAFHYSNCQPLGAFENLSKSSLYKGEKHIHCHNDKSITADDLF